jgi:hypothetical protein
MPDKPGVYTLTYDDGVKMEKMFSVNPSPKESQLAYVDAPEALTAWRVNLPPGTGKSAVAAPRGKLSLSGILQQRWWWWMVMGGLAALMLEMTLAEIGRERVITGQSSRAGAPVSDLAQRTQVLDVPGRRPALRGG